MPGTIVGKSEKVGISVDELLNGDHPITIDLHCPVNPELGGIKTDDLEELSYSAKRVADSFYNLISKSNDWDNLINLRDERFEMYIALSGLACEIYLKTLLFRYKCIKATERKKHNLLELFEILEACQRDVSGKIQTITCMDESYSFAAELDIVKTIFNDFRYSYELNGYQINVSFIKSFTNALKQVSDEMILSRK